MRILIRSIPLYAEELLALNIIAYTSSADVHWNPELHDLREVQSVVLCVAQRFIEELVGTGVFRHLPWKEMWRNDSLLHAASILSRPLISHKRGSISAIYHPCLPIQASG